MKVIFSLLLFLLLFPGHILAQEDKSEIDININIPEFDDENFFFEDFNKINDDEIIETEDFDNNEVEPEISFQKPLIDDSLLSEPSLIDVNQDIIKDLTKKNDNEEILFPDLSDIVDSIINKESKLNKAEKSLVLWLDANNINGQNNMALTQNLPIEKWVDLSNNNLSIQQENNDARPILKQKALNNKDIIRFDGKNDFFILNQIKNWPSSDISIFIIQKSRKKKQSTISIKGLWPDFGRFNLQIPSNNGKVIWDYGLNDEKKYARVTKSLPKNYDNNFQLYYFDYNNTNRKLSVFYNGKEFQTKNTQITSIYNVNDKQDFQLKIGKSDNQEVFLKGDIAEILIFNQVLTANDRNNINFYLSKKWGLLDNIDSDADGLSDAAEIEIGSIVTNPNDPKKEIIAKKTETKKKAFSFVKPGEEKTIEIKTIDDVSKDIDKKLNNLVLETNIISDILSDNEFPQIIPIPKPIGKTYDSYLSKFFDKRIYNKQNNHIFPVEYQEEYFQFLFSVIDNSNIEGIKAITKKIGPQYDIFLQDMSPLTFAVYKADIDIIRKMLSLGYNPDKLDLHGKAPLHYAVEIKQYEIATELLLWGADINVKNHHGFSPFDIASSNNDIIMLELLDKASY